MLLAAIALLAGACGVSRENSSSGPAVATIEFGTGDNVTVLEIDDAELDSIANSVIDSPEFRGIAYAPEATEDDIKADILTRLVYGRIITSELDKLGIDPDSIDISETRAGFQLQLEGAFAGEEDPVAFASDVGEQIDPFLNELSTLVAHQDQLGATLLENVGPAEMVEVPCASHILLDASDAELAENLIGQLNDGGDFATLAQEFSTGPSGPGGGDLGCADPANYVPEFRDAIVGAPAGEIIGPVETQFGLHIIVVNEIVEQEVGLADPNQLSGQVIQQELTQAVIIASPDSGFLWEPGSQSFIVAPGG